MWARRQRIALRDWPSTRLAQVQTRFVACRRFFIAAMTTILPSTIGLWPGAADLPLFVYNLPGATGVEITPRMMAKIQDRVPQLTGLKHSALTFANVQTFAQMELSCFIGNHRLMLPAMTIGACGCVDGPLNVLPELWVAIWTAYRAGDLQAAEAAQEKATHAYDALSASGGFHSVIKAALSARLGIDCGDPRPPGKPVSDAQRAQIEETMAKLV